MQDKSRVQLNAIIKQAQATILEAEVEVERREDILLDNRWVVRERLEDLWKGLSRLDPETTPRQREIWLQGQTADLITELFRKERRGRAE